MKLEYHILPRISVFYMYKRVSSSLTPLKILYLSSPLLSIINLINHATNYKSKEMK